MPQLEVQCMTIKLPEESTRDLFYLKNQDLSTFLVHQVLYKVGPNLQGLCSVMRKVLEMN